MTGLERFYDQVLLRVTNGEMDRVAASVALKEIRGRIETMRGRQELNGHGSRLETADTATDEQRRVMRNRANGNADNGRRLIAQTQKEK